MDKLYGNFVLETKLIPEGYEYNVKEIRSAVAQTGCEPDPAVYEKMFQKQLKNKQNKEKKKLAKMRK